MEAERADVEKSGADELIPLEQTDESKSIEALTENGKATTRPESSRGTETKGVTRKAKP